MEYWDGTSVPAKPWSDEAEGKFGWDFVACLNYNPAPGFTAEDVEELTVVDMDDAWRDQQRDGSVTWEAVLADGRRFRVEGWCDYTGWDCQSGAEYTLIEEAK